MYKMIFPASVIVALALGLHFEWSYVKPYMHNVIVCLSQFKKYSDHHALVAYSIYAGVTCAIILLGLPISTPAMLIAGTLFGFWEATTLVTFCRFTVAMLTFMLARHIYDQQESQLHYKPSNARILRFVESHPKASILLVRLMPIPDTIVNYTMAVTPIRNYHYAVMSLIGMLPVTLFCVALGHHLGGITKVINYLH